MSTVMRIGSQAEVLDASEALTASGTAAWRWEIGSPVIEWSPAAADTLGLPEIVLRSPQLLREAIDPSDLALLATATEGWRDEGHVLAQIRIHLGGRVRWFDVSGRVVVTGDATPHYATGTVREVTEAREAQDALLDALHEAEVALEHLHAVKDAAGLAVRGRVA